MNEDRTTTELARYLATMGIDATLVRREVEMPSVERATEALGVAPAVIVKSIVLEHSQDPTRVCLVIVPGDRRVSRPKVAAALDLGPLRLASAETVQRATGYRPGGVPPVGHRAPLPVVVDRHVFEHDVVFGGGGDGWHMLRIRPRDIKRLTGARVADVIEEPQPSADGATA